MEYFDVIRMTRWEIVKLSCLETTLIHSIILLHNFQRDLTPHLIWLWIWRENFWAPEVLDWKTSLMEFKECLHGMVLWDGAVQGKSWTWWSQRVPSDPAHSLWFFDSVIMAITVKRKCQALWNYCSCLSTVMKLLT